ncbi:MAG: glycosyltransferase, partial [Alcaligenaceae bacterium]|nr:glycosyltransferase [Alcaligenaceae bacterium]
MTSSTPPSGTQAPGRELSGATLSCVVPACNEHDNLGLLLPRLQAVL